MSFTQAGRELGITQSAISQHVRLLEAHLGQPLFHRLPQRLALTESGRAYLPAVQEGFQRIGAGTREVFGPMHGDHVTLRATPGFAEFWLASRLPGIMAAHPALTLRVLSSVWDAEFAAGGADLEIRYGTGEWSGLTCERLVTESVFPVAAPETARRLARDSAELANERRFHTVGFRVTWQQWLDAAGLASIVSGGAGDHFDTAILPLRLAEQGAGVALGRTSLTSASLAAGRLEAPLAPALDTDEGFFLCWPAGERLSAGASRLVEALSAAEP